jgi:hypothetical protein
MSEEVYFNEPGYEGEANTDEGDKKNEGYSNIVRYNTCKHAILGHLTNPPIGFENVIRTHFYLKKDIVMKEIQGWIKVGKEKEAKYQGLVLDHNHKWASRFKTKNVYVEDMEEIYEKIVSCLTSLSAPNPADLLSSKLKKIGEQATKEIGITEGLTNLDDIDVAYDSDLAN